MPHRPVPTSFEAADRKTTKALTRNPRHAQLAEEAQLLATDPVYVSEARKIAAEMMKLRPRLEERS